MSVSNIKRLYNEMKLIEEDSDRYISSDTYYILKIVIDSEDFLKIERRAKEFLTHTNHQPLIVYIFDNTIHLVFSCCDEGKRHYLLGSHSQIISNYASLLGKEFNTHVNTNIIEFETRNQILTYFFWRVHENSRLGMVRVSNNQIGISDIRNKTQQELIDKLNELGIEWNSLDNSKRYGIFYKLKKVKDGTTISSLSESIDARDIKKYSVFIFGV